jgi:acetyltransferase-like isoleucine patch superfamily enzyme
MKRRLERFPVSEKNSLHFVYQSVPFWRVMKNFIVIQISCYTPYLPLKNWLFKTFLGVKVGEHASVALMVMLDILVPEKITIGKNSIIGYNTTILAHEYLIGEYRFGEVIIGKNVMIGANCTILPGVSIGDGAIVGAGTVVHKDVPTGAFVAGNPMVTIRSANKGSENS